MTETKGKLRTPSGGESRIQRQHLVKQIDRSRVTEPISGKAFDEARREATAAGTLNEFYDRVYLSALHEQLQQGDEVWKYSTIDALSGDAGYCVIRGDTVFAHYAVLLS